MRINGARVAGVLCVTLGGMSASALGINGNYIETFSTGLNGWGGGSSPTLVPSGGPDGAGDAYLRISSNAGVGNGNLATLNTGANWTGDYAGDWSAPGQYLILGASARLANFGTEPLSIRAIFFNTATNRYSTAEVAMVPADGLWRRFDWLFSPVDGSGLEQVGGSVPITTGMHSVTQIMFRHNVLPGAGGDAVTGTLGMDNIRLLPFIPAPATAALMAMGAGVLARRRR